MQTSSSGAMTTSFGAGRPDARAMASSQCTASSGRSPSALTATTCRGPAPRSPSNRGSTRSNRSASHTSAPAPQSVRPNFISAVVHQAFIPTTAAPSDTVAQ